MNEFLFSILAWINSWVGSWGWSMVVFTVMIRLILTPLDVKSRVSMRKTTKLQPQLAALQKKYANDKDKLNQKTAELYRKEKINPLSSCLPLLLTWPILIAVFAAMRMAANKEMLLQVGQLLNNETPVLENWLWIKNLWMPDSPFSPAYPDLNTLRQIGTAEWVEWFKGFETSGVPALLQGMELTADSFSGSALQTTVESIYTAMSQNPVYVQGVAVKAGWTFNLLIAQFSLMDMFNGLMILPVLSAVSQVIMTKVMGGQQAQPQGQDQTAASTGKFMQWFFPLFSLWICFGYSAAFALYWVAGNLVSMAQTYVINKVLDNKEKQAALTAGEGSVK